MVMVRVEDGLRERLIAALRPRMTRVEAEMTVMSLLDEVRQYAVEVAGQAMAEQADLIAEVIKGAQDCVEIIWPPAGDPTALDPPADDSPAKAAS